MNRRARSLCVLIITAGIACGSPQEPSGKISPPEPGSARVPREPYELAVRYTAAWNSRPTPAMDGSRRVGLESEGSPEYVTAEAVSVMEQDAVEPPTLPVVRVYRAYRPWGEPGVQLSLDRLGYIRGKSLFVHPITDLAQGIPAGTAVVIVPSASQGDKYGQIRTVNDKAVQRGLRRFVADGGTLVLHRWRPGAGTPHLKLRMLPAAADCAALQADRRSNRQGCR